MSYEDHLRRALVHLADSFAGVTIRGEHYSRHLRLHPDGSFEFLSSDRDRMMSAPAFTIVAMLSSDIAICTRFGLEPPDVSDFLST